MAYIDGNGEEILDFGKLQEKAKWWIKCLNAFKFFKYAIPQIHNVFFPTSHKTIFNTNEKSGAKRNFSTHPLVQILNMTLFLCHFHPVPFYLLLILSVLFCYPGAKPNNNTSKRRKAILEIKSYNNQEQPESQNPTVFYSSSPVYSCG